VTRKYFAGVFFALLLTLTSQEVFSQGVKNPDGSISNNSNNGGKDHTGECTKKFTITPNPVLAEVGTPAPVTFDVGFLGGQFIDDKDNLVPESLPNFNIYSEGIVSWTANGPNTQFPSQQKPGAADKFYRLTTQHPTIPWTYQAAGCEVITTIVGGQFKNTSDAEHGSYTCQITQTVVVEVAYPGTTIQCPQGVVLYQTKLRDTLSGVAKKVYGNSRHWKNIREANHLNAGSLEYLSEGTKLVIPVLPKTWILSHHRLRTPLTE
jgi:hypothetical protein